MSPKSNRKFVSGVLIIIVAFAFLIAGSMKSSAMRQVPVGALRAADTSNRSHVGQRLRVVGFVSHAPVRRVVDASPHSGDHAGGAGSVQYFQVVDKNQTLAVEYRDALPETFKAGSPVQIDGLYYAPGRFRAERVLTKCPSKYQAEQVKNQKSEVKNQKKSQKSSYPSS